MDRKIKVFSMNNVKTANGYVRSTDQFRIHLNSLFIYFLSWIGISSDSKPMHLLNFILVPKNR